MGTAATILLPPTSGLVVSRLGRRALRGRLKFLCASSDAGESANQTAVRQIWRLGPLQGLQGVTLGTERVRHAVLAPSSHNTQCWKFALKKDTITVLPDFSRSCPAVDPDDHRLVVSLGWAAENLVQAA